MSITNHIKNTAECYLLKLDHEQHHRLSSQETGPLVGMFWPYFLSQSLKIFLLFCDPSGL
jgi:hypothetical protein